MVFEITHPEKPTEHQKIDDNDYMLPHHVSGVLPDLSGLSGNKIRLPVLIEEKNITASTGTTFNNLNGYNEKEYIIIVRLAYTGLATGEIRLLLLLNNITTGYSSSLRRYSPTGTDHLLNTEGFNILRDIKNSNTNYIFGDLNLSIKQGSPCHLGGLTMAKPTAYTNVLNIITDLLPDPGVTITSLSFEPQNCNLTGTIKLYKLLDITLEDLNPS